jgi:hypothetical protein
MDGQENAGDPAANANNLQEGAVSNQDKTEINGDANHDGGGDRDDDADDDDETEGEYYEVEKILDEEIEDGQLYYFVRWRGFSPSNDTREPAEQFEHCTDVLAVWEKEKAQRDAVRTRTSNTLFQSCTC